MGLVPWCCTQTTYPGGGGAQTTHPGGGGAQTTHPGGGGGAQVSCSPGPEASVSCPSSAERDRCGSGCAVEMQILHQPVNKWIFLKCDLFSHHSTHNNSCLWVNKSTGFTKEFAISVIFIFVCSDTNSTSLGRIPPYFSSYTKANQMHHSTHRHTFKCLVTYSQM